MDDAIVPGRLSVPSLSALAAFEAAARHSSFTRAAEELNLTQGAVSRQVAHLEEVLGVSLFERVKKRVSLTVAGAAYAAEVRDGLSRLAAATVSAMAFRGAAGVLNLAILPTFGTRWLIPRLPRFTEAHPGITINFATKLVPFDFTREPLDAAVHFGDPVWPGARLHRLMGEEIVPVASPALVARFGLSEPADMLKAPLLQQSTRPRAWANWLEEQGLPPQRALMGPRFEQFAMVSQAAVAGLGLAIVPRFLVEEELRSGALVIPVERSLIGREGYYLVYPEEKASLPTVAAFRDWLLAECAPSA
ncbi:transcriptional regulator GcvA [Bosea minatitlanensis]|uniref:Transcriptional regulator GcvA n=1 Tax=Bosea minatitlanensis TaxID=128782 RepID=A0ABW0FAH8_9HYPH|nr:transcriptional regulator GcvA [Bosea minatitlanensis]MCT4493082.1 transcriptional regulator GcvA [Bosea minatitlanensis]